MHELCEGTRVLSFDCYGTLIDWEGGVRAAVRALPSLESCDVERLVRDREAADVRLTKTGYLSYDKVLRDSLREAADAQGAGVTGEEAREFAFSMSHWPAFEEATAALERLAGKYRLAILSNVRTAVLERSVELLGVPFDELITAEQLHSYKPRHDHFAEALRRLKVPKEAMLHVACSPYHDLAPAESLGWRDVWVDRTGGNLPAGLAPAATVRDLTQLCELCLAHG